MPRRLVLAAPLALALAVAVACGAPDGTANAAEAEAMAPGIPAAATDGEHGVAVFAGGCFWCIESVFDVYPGVISAVSGYAGGPELQPTYKQVAYGQTGHTESVRVVFDPKKVTYEELVDVFWRNIDPWQKNGQFCDKGPHYRSEIFVADAEQRRIAEASKAAVNQRFGRPSVTAITDAPVFWPAEGYHQNYWEKNPVRYISYRTGCGRDRRLAEIWGDDATH